MVSEFQVLRRIQDVENQNQSQEGDLQSLNNRVSNLEQSDGSQNAELGNLGSRVGQVETGVGDAKGEAGQARAEASQARSDARQAQADAAQARADASQAAKDATAAQSGAAQATRDAAAAKADAAAAQADATAAGQAAADARSRADSVKDKVDNQIEPALVGKVPFADFRDHETEFDTFRDGTNRRLGSVETGVQEAKTAAQEAKDDAQQARGDANVANIRAGENGQAISDLQSRTEAQSGQLERLTGELDRVGGVAADASNKVDSIGQGLDSFKYNIGEAAEAGRDELAAALTDISNASSHLSTADQKWGDAVTAGITAINQSRSGIETLVSGAANLSWSTMESGFNTLKDAFFNFIAFPQRIAEAAGATIAGARDVLKAVTKVRGAGSELRKSLERAADVLPSFQ